MCVPKRTAAEQAQHAAMMRAARRHKRTYEPAWLFVARHGGYRWLRRWAADELRLVAGHLSPDHQEATP